MFCITACWRANVQLDESKHYKEAFDRLIHIESFMISGRRAGSIAASLLFTRCLRKVFFVSVAKRKSRKTRGLQCEMVYFNHFCEQYRCI